MRFQDIPRTPTAKMLRQFGILSLILFVALGAYHYGMHQREWLGISLMLLGFCFGLLGWLRPQWLAPIFIGWMIAVFPISWILSHLILGFLFYGCFLPIGWVLRCRGYDPLRLKRPLDSSYWQDRQSNSDKRRYLRQY